MQQIKRSASYLAQHLLQLRAISIIQFKNYAGSVFHFPNRITAICGKNGIGKTNLLDAIYYLCFTKSYFGRTDGQNVHNGSSGFRIEGDFEDNGQSLKTVVVLRENGKKEFSINNESYSRFSSHIGRFPSVIIAPDDVQIISGASEERRRFLDALLSQLDADYLQQLISYTKVLQQRNMYLRSIENRNPDKKLLDVYDSQLTEFGNKIYNTRKIFLQQFVQKVRNFYQQIAGSDESIDILYKSQLSEATFPELFLQFREKDILLQRTNAGVHKDDLEIRMNDQPFKTLASQGQRKSLLFSMKLAEFETLKLAKGFPPILLLDDVFEKLDADRMRNLLHWVCVQNEGQIFITDTHTERVSEHLGALTDKYHLIELD